MASSLTELIGTRFGKLVVTKMFKQGKYILCGCTCDCGNEKTIRKSHLTSGNTVSCGCKRNPSHVGKRFGRLEVKSKNVKGERGYYVCQCDCGNFTTVRGDALVSGATKSCGCLNDETRKETHTQHGDSNSRLYRIYQKMRERCYNYTNERYERYGGRGIVVCDEWLVNYETFKHWALSNGYADNLSIDRKNNDGNYTPENCRWVDFKTQANNTSRNINIYYAGETKTLTQWCECLGLDYDRARRKLRRGMVFENIVREGQEDG